MSDGLIYFEDLEIGEVHNSASDTVTKEDIIQFGRAFDPQPFHIDEAAAKDSFFGGLIASGWHTASIMMHLLVTSMTRRSAVLASPGFDDLRWLAPVRPGDSLTIRSTCIDKQPSRSKPDIGSVRWRTEVLNQDGNVVMSVINIGLIRRRGGSGQTAENENG